MCGRYTLKTPVDALAREFGISGPLPEIPASYNIAPTRQVAAVLFEGGGRKLEMLRWGLIPSWAKDPEIGNRMINARSETAPEKPSYRKAFKERRCLIPADGFYEWQKMNGGKQPYYFRMKGGGPFAFAGLWETWDRDGEEIRSCTILTTAPNEIAAEVHDRMPVILSREDHDFWLDPEVDETGALRELLVPYPAEEMEAYPVSRHVNRPTNDDERCVEPAA
jgi:putative SOS response-associated peptidase YedK